MVASDGAVACQFSRAIHPFDLEDISPVALAYQTGYLTIRHYQSGVFDLAYPNEEVRQSMTTYLLGAYTNLKADNVIPLINNIRKAFATKEINLLQTNMERLFANIPYQHHNSNESYYHGIMQTIGTLLGIDMQSEVSTSRGRIDLVVNMNRYLYLIELKVDKTAEEALEQIQELGYVEKYQGSGKEIILIGINFSSKDKRLSFASLAK